VCVFTAMLTLIIKLCDDFNLDSCVAPRVLRIMFVALGPKRLYTSALNAFKWHVIDVISQKK